LRTFVKNQVADRQYNFVSGLKCREKGEIIGEKREGGEGRRCLAGIATYSEKRKEKPDFEKWLLKWYLKFL